ncbi:methyltransferase [Advenella kashmirensis W13003]|uniref:Methyltransferase n=1 Tax=Advenella kashmirensis W13003 TaxID=1424334 RepID=V8QQA5_9BURK|nr:class I SAM-dependent methyltransferase [Advenella kashmirensis]ETF02136.1 methyltransferase [Advenella kashmirensis W13003]
MKDYYAARANEYDNIYLKPERQDDLQDIRAWLTAELTGRKVLEIACGTGYWTQFYAPSAQRVVAVDAADETLVIAAERVSPNVQLLQGDAFDLPAFDMSFDAAFAGFWWSHISRKDIVRFLTGLHGSLEPGAEIIFLDNRFVPGSSTPIAEQDAAGNTYQRRALQDGSTHRVLKNFPTREQLLADISPHAKLSQYCEWEYFWALKYSLKR